MTRAILTYSSTEPLPPSRYPHARPLGFKPYQARKPEKEKFIADIMAIIDEYAGRNGVVWCGATASR